MMEQKLIAALDRLTVEQTEQLLDDAMDMKINGRARSRIKDSVRIRTDSKRKGFYVPKRLAVCAAAFVMVFAVLGAVGFDTVAAALGKLFTFIPGVAIAEKTDTTIYTYDPMVAQIKSQTAKANIVSAVYANGYLNVTVEVEGRAIYSDGFVFYVDQKPVNADDAECLLAVSTDSTILDFSYETAVPADDDIFEVDVAGFAQRLSFKMIPCRDYDDQIKIGPTDTQNGISITATANRIDNQLVVWCYPFRMANATNDFILGYGEPSFGSFNTMKYVNTESGQIYGNAAGWQIRGRTIFNLPEDDQTATLHIPYLSMLRSEKKRLGVEIPQSYTTVDSNVAVQCSLGTIRVTEIKREPNAHETDKDTIMIKFTFDSNESNMILNSFNFEIVGEHLSNAMHFNEETGCLEYLEIYVEKDAKKVALRITDLHYYLLGEYVIPLDVQ